MKVLILSSYSEFGGAERSLFRLMMEMKKNNLELLLVSFGNGPLIRESQKLGIKTHIYKRIGLKKRLLFFYYLKYLKENKELIKIVNEYKPNLIFCNAVGVFSLGAYLRKKTSLPCVGTMRDPFTKTHFKYHRFFIIKYYINHYFWP